IKFVEIIGRIVQWHNSAAVDVDSIAVEIITTKFVFLIENVINLGVDSPQGRPGNATGTELIVANRFKDRLGDQRTNILAHAAEAGRINDVEPSLVEEGISHQLSVDLPSACRVKNLAVVHRTTQNVGSNLLS